MLFELRLSSNSGHGCRAGHSHSRDRIVLQGGDRLKGCRTAEGSPRMQQESRLSTAGPG
jgi:hypothetical protein